MKINLLLLKKKLSIDFLDICSSFKSANILKFINNFKITSTLCFILCLAQFIANAQTPLKQKAGSLTTANGPIASSSPNTTATDQVVTLFDGVAAYSPATTVTYHYRDQQYGNAPGQGPLEGLTAYQGMIFGGGSISNSNGPPAPNPRNSLMSGVSSASNAMFNACATCAAGTSITTTTDYAVWLANIGDAFINSANVNLKPLDARVYMGELVISFNRPVSNPVLQVVGLGGQSYYENGSGGTGVNYRYYSMGLTTEFDLVGSNVVLSKLAGNPYLSVSGTSITNNATWLGANSNGQSYFTGDVTRYAASGSVLATGTNITSITLKVFLRGDGGRISNASNTQFPTGFNGLKPQWSYAPNTFSFETNGSVITDGYLLATTLTKPVTLSGNVFNDPNGGNVNTSTGVANAVPTGLFAYLVDNLGNVVQQVPVNANGTYSFPAVSTGNYTVEISTTVASQGSPAPAVVLPAGFSSTGEFTGTPNTGNDGTPNGTSTPITVAAVDITNINFGIQQPPESAVNTQPSQVNPGGTANVTVPPTAFLTSTLPANPNTSDLSGGTVTNIRITAFPANATSITINGMMYTSGTFPAAGIIVPFNPLTGPTQAITIDPVNGTVAVVLSFVAIDNGGVEDPTPGSVTLPFTQPGGPSVSGNVFNDPNGGNVNNSSGGANTAPPGLFANLIDNMGNVVSSVPVNADGTYTYPTVPPGTYTVSISTTSGTQGNPAPAPNLPPGFVSTGEFNGAPNTGNDGTPNGTSAPFTVVTGVNTTNINFATNQLPESAINTQPTQTNPGGTTSITIPPSAFLTSTLGTNPNTSDVGGGTVTSIRITAFPANATSITINGITYIASNWPVGGVTIPFNPTTGPTWPIAIDPVDGTAAVVLPFAAIDNSGAEDPTPGSVTIPFILPNNPSVSGNVFNDPNGGNVNNSTGGPNMLPTGLIAYLIDDMGNVAQQVPVNFDGSYTFNSVPAGDYHIVVTTVVTSNGSTAPAVVLPTGWNPTGDYNGTPNTGNDGTPNATSTVFTVTTNNVSNINIGIQQLPETAINTQPSQTNPGGTVNVTVPPTAFLTSTSAINPNTSDYSGGTVTNIRITAFPTNATSITINGTTYTSGTWPAGGVVVPFNPTTGPTQTITIDPINGTAAVVIPFVSIDNGGNEDPTPGSVTVPFTDPGPPPSVSGNVFNDLNGGNVNNSSGGVNMVPPGLFANLIDFSGNVAASVPVNPDGTFIFPTVIPNVYTVSLSTTTGTPGSPAPVASLPPGFVNTGEFNGIPNSGTDLNVNGISALFEVPNGTSVTNINFGINQLPESAVNLQPTQGNPTSTNSVTVPTGAFNTSNVGTNPNTQDYGGGVVTSIIITTFPTNATSITINGVLYTSSTWPVGGVTVPYTNGVGAAVPIKIDPIDGNVTVVIAFVAVDNAGAVDPTPGTVSLPFSATLVPVAVKYESFTATKVGNTSLLKFMIAQPVFGSVFTIERSENGITFKPLGSILSTTSLDYAYVDAAPIYNAKNFYRVKEIDESGKVSYSEIRILKFVNDGKIDVYPNPANSVLNIVMGNELTNKKLSIQLYNLQGQLVISKTVVKVNGSEFLDLYPISSGTYLLKIVSNKETITNKKVIVIK